MMNTGKTRNFHSGKNGNSSSMNSSGNGNNYKPPQKTPEAHMYYIRAAKSSRLSD
jgi:hypothetical protein